MPESPGTLDRLLTPRGVFVSLAVLLAIVLLLAPWPESTSAGASPSSYRADPNGARGLHDALERLGFDVDRRLVPMRDDLDSASVYLVLDPPIEPTALEVHRLLDAVRGGAGLLVLPSEGSRIADSLGVMRAPTVGRSRGTAAADPRTSDRVVIADTIGVFSRGFVRWVLRSTSRDTSAASGGRRAGGRAYTAPADATVFGTLETERGRETTIAGLPFGRGRIVFVADPDLFRNVVVRQGDAAVQAVRLVEWLAGDGVRERIVFDEYHQGYGTQASIMRVARRTLVRTRGGRVVLQLAIAGLVLLLAVGARPLRPRPRTRIQRRSPLEHVGALARAYAAVHAGGRATRLLVRGLRRRTVGTRGSEDEADYLRRVADRHPEVSDDVTKLIEAMQRDDTADGDVVSAIVRVERSVTG